MFVNQTGRTLQRLGGQPAAEERRALTIGGHALARRAKREDKLLHHQHQHHHQHHHRHRSSSSSSTDLVVAASTRHRASRQLSPLFEIPIPAESLGQAFFFHYYSIVGPKCPRAVQDLKGPPTSSLLSRLAVGMAGVAIAKKDTAFLAQARSKYGQSLIHINSLIHDDTRKEIMLADINKMAMFEVRHARLRDLVLSDSTPVTNPGPFR